MSVTAQQIVDLFLQHGDMLKTRYPKIAPFQASEIQDFLDGKDGAPIPNSIMQTTRSHQVRQYMSVIGAMLVDQGKADANTVHVYKSVWQLELDCTCEYCKKDVKSKLMMGRRTVCTKPRCVLQYQRDSH